MSSEDIRHSPLSRLPPEGHMLALSMHLGTLCHCFNYLKLSQMSIEERNLTIVPAY